MVNASLTDADKVERLQLAIRHALEKIGELTTEDFQIGGDAPAWNELVNALTITGDTEARKDFGLR